MVSTLPNPNPERRLAALARVLKLLRETENFNELVSTLLKNLKEELPYALFWFGVYERKQHQIISQGYEAPKPHQLLKSNFSLSPGDLMEQVVIQQRPLIVNDLRIETRIAAWNNLAEQLDIQGALVFPVRRRDVCYGVLLMGAHEWGQTVSNSDRTFISIVASALADFLHKREQTLQNQNRKDPGTAVSSLIDQLKSITTRDDQLATISQSVFQFIKADRVRVFWLNPTEFEFWERLSVQSSSSMGQKRYSSNKGGLTVGASKIPGIYQVLQNHQLCVVGESNSSHTIAVPDQFMKMIKASALIAAPIFENQMLLGFISVESKQPQVWTEVNRNYLKTVANLAGLTMPSLSIEEIRQQSDDEVKLLTGLVHSIQNDADWQQTLEKYSEIVLQAVDAKQFLVLLHDAERDGYNVVFRKTGALRNRFPTVWPSLEEVDWQMLESCESAITINDVTHDLKLLAWRENIQTMEAKSLLACNVFPESAPEGIVILTSQSPRQWALSDAQLLQKIARQIGLILRQWQLQRQTNQQEDLYDSIQWGLRTLQQTFDLKKLEESACQHLIELLDVSLVVLVTWQVGEPVAQISGVVSRSADFKVDEAAQISVGSDAIINWAQQTDGPLPVTLEDFPASTLQWISGPPGSRFLLMALKTVDKHVPNGVWIVATQHERKWTDHDLSLLSLLSNQLAWSRRHLKIVDLLLSRQESLETLNWYKHKRLAEVYRHLDANLQRLNHSMTQGRELPQQQQLQLIRQLGTLTHNLRSVLHYEAWELQGHQQTTPLISLLNRLMERVNPLIQDRQLWAKVHNDSNVIISGDLDKIEFVLFELVVAACERSPAQGRLDIWCRPLDRALIELAITDDGNVPQDLLKDLKDGRPDDILVPSPLDVPPGLHFSICQNLMEEIGGEFSLQRLEDGRIMSRVILTIARKGMKRPNEA